jgi:integrase/recombinase XerD
MFERTTRNPIQQMLRLALPHYEGKKRTRLEKPFINIAPNFYTYLNEERGLRPTTIEHYIFKLRRFESYLSKIRMTNLNDLSQPILSAFFADNRSLSTSALSGLCDSLRVFLRYLHREQLISRNLSSLIESPKNYRLSNIPRSISWDEVRKMLESVDRRTASGKRDFAILLLLVTYGLRAHEVANLTIDDIDWKRERLRVPERKAGHSTAYPLSTAVGEAILTYLKEVRPKTTDRHIFFRIPAPQTPIKSSAVANRATCYLRKAGVMVTRAGSHTLRHTCVQRLLDTNFSLKTIGDYVGHRSPASTNIYSKVAIETLREVANTMGEKTL